MRVKNFFLSVVLMHMLGVTLFAQQDTAAINSIRKFQHELDGEYKDPKTSPLGPFASKQFTGHDYFPVDLTFRVEATLTVTGKEPYFKMLTSNGKPRNFRQYGILTFMLNDKEITIPVYQSQQLMGSDDYADYLFLPFTDLTTGQTTYSAGRYLDLRIPTTGNTLTVDFNKAYNPLCAYSDQYSCPLVPDKNNLALEINAGVRFTNKH